MLNKISVIRIIVFYCNYLFVDLYFRLCFVGFAHVRGAAKIDCHSQSERCNGGRYSCDVCQRVFFVVGDWCGYCFSGWLYCYAALVGAIYASNDFLSIISALALVIVLCVGWRVYRASNENPADVLKSE